METIFLLLSGVILLAGVLYWFWSHIQLTQKKVHLLENAVFELRTMLAGRAPPGPGDVAPAVSSSTVATPFASSPSAPYRDLDDDEWTEAAPDATPLEQEVKVVQTLPPPIRDTKEAHTLESIIAEREQEDGVAEVVDPALQPGGRIEAAVVEEEKESGSEEQFKNLFVPPTTSATTPVAADSLDGMPVKELRRLAEQRGITGAADMRKKEILAALKAQIQPALTIPEPSVAVEKVEEEAMGELTLEAVE